MAGTDLDGDAFVDLLRRALEEDRAQADVTSQALVPPDRSAVGDVRVKEPGVICGLPLLRPCFRLLDPAAEVELRVEEGARVGAGTIVATVKARAQALLGAERVALNLLQHLSGIATLTAEYVEGAMATGAGVYDTRKTTPGLRALERHAVRCGGGRSHRADLSDAAMVKENHLRAAYGRTGPEAVTRAVRTLAERLPPSTPLFVEVESLEELDAALVAGASRGADLVVMLDDFGIDGIRAAVARVRALPPPRPRLEITGGVRLDNVGALASTGAHRLSSGALTHSARALDISLKIRA